VAHFCFIESSCLSIRVAELLQTKLQRPGVTRNFVFRPRLVERLNQGVSGPLTLVCAPAGFGKSTLVSSWIDTGGVTPPLPCAWLSLDENDSDLVLFLRYFIAALRTVFSDACAQSAEILAAPQQLPVDAVVTTLSNEIAQLPGRFVLVMDDYHTVHGEAVPAFVNALGRHWPQPMHLVLISRLNPPLPLASLRARGQLVEIRAHHLRFTPEETACYVARVLPAPLSEPAATFLQERTEGWIAGLHLAGLSLRAGEDPDVAMESLSGLDADIAGYMVDEVLLRQPPAIQAFLLRTAILDRFCAPLCEAIGASGDPECDVRACIEWLQHAELFVISLDHRREWYRYHHLFQDLLQQRLLAEVDVDQVNELHGRAAAWFAGQGLIDEALRHALAADDLDLAARIAEQGLRDVLNREDRPTLERWLRLFPEELVQHRRGLLMLKAWALMFSWQLGAVTRVIEQADALIDQDIGCADPDGLSLLRGQMAVLRGQQAYYRNRPAETVACCEEALALLPASWTYVRGGAMLFWAMGMRASGRGDAAQRALLEQYESLSEKADGYALRLLFAACHNYVESGQLEHARQTAQLMLEQATRSRLTVLQGWAHYFLGLAGYYRNELDAAAQHLHELVEKRYAIHAMAARNGMITLALVHLARGETSVAWRTMDLLSQFDMARVGHEPDDTRSLRARLQFLQGNLEDASSWAEAFTAPVPDEPLTWLEDPHLTKACILLANGREVDARAALRTLDARYDTAERTHNTRGRIEIETVRALALGALGRASDAQAALRQAVGLSRVGGFIRPFVDPGPRLRDMLIRLAAQGFAPPTLHRILAASPGSPPAAALADAQSAIGNRHHPGSVWDPGQSAIVEPLTAREYDVLILLRERLSDKEIAQKLCLSTATVKRHLVNIYSKLGVHKRLEAVLEAETLGLLPPG
jgi:LuxR family maltose regulon positive regulatory protein